MHNRDNFSVEEALRLVMLHIFFGFKLVQITRCLLSTTKIPSIGLDLSKDLPDLDVLA